MTIAAITAPAIARLTERADLRCPNCRHLILRWRVSDPAGGTVAALEVRCRRCHRTFDAELRADGATATVRPASG